METEQTAKTYDDILDVVCSELQVKKKEILSANRTADVSFARCLYTLLAKDMGLNLPRAVVLINKSRTMLHHYLGIAEQDLTTSLTKYEQYKKCCKRLGIEPSLTPPEKEVAIKKEAINIKKRIGELKPNNHYTMGEEIAMVRAIESSIRFMKNYGKGTQPLVGGCVFTRKGRTRFLIVAH